MKRLLVAGFAALAVVLGLVATTGVASAAAPSVLDVRGAGCAGTTVFDRNNHQCETQSTGTAPACTGGQVLDSILNVCVAANVNVGGGRDRGGFDGRDRGGFGDHGVNPGGPIDGGGFNGHVGGPWHPGLPWGGPALYGHQVWVDANLGLDVCGYDSWSSFESRNAAHRDAILRALGASPMQRWNALHQSDCNSGLAVLPGGLSLVNGQFLNLDLLGLQGGGLQSVCSYADWNSFDSRLGGRFGNRFGAVRNHFGGNAFNEFRQLRVNAHCTTVVVPSSTTIVQEPSTTVEAAPADPSGDDGVSNAPASTPAPLASAPLPANAPVKAPSDGGVDINAVLTQARVA
jgi:hypothetical protein